MPSRLWCSRHLDQLELGKAVKESFMVGEQVVQSINADPMLPREMVDTELRTTQIRAMKKYNKLAARLWLDFSLA